MDIENVQKKYDQLWNRAWTLADKIDDYQSGIPVEIRRSMMLELDRMRAELSRLESLGARPHGGKVEPVNQAKYSAVLKEKETNPGVCPARCKQTGKCYGRTWFTGKPGPFPGPICNTVSGCMWLKRAQTII